MDHFEINHAGKPLCVVLDANIWRSSLMLKTPIGAAFLYTLKRSNGFIGLPEIIWEEVIKHIVKAGLEAGDSINKSFRTIAVLVGSRPEYQLPSADELEKHAIERFAELQNLIISVPFTLKHAKSALNKVFLELPPNGPKNQQFKDSAIWEAVLDLSTSYDIHFISNDNGYYKDRDTKRGISSNLKGEIDSKGSVIILHSDLSLFLSAIKSSIPPLNETILSELISDFIREDLAKVVGKRAFELRNLINYSIEPYLTERIGILAIEYKFKYNLIDISADDISKTLPQVAASGSCYYNIDTGELSELRKGNEEFTWLDEEGQAQQNKNMYAYMDGFLGPKKIPYTFKEPL